MEKLKLKKHPETGELVPEAWKEIEGHDGFYEISNYGRVKSWKAGNGSGKRRSEPKLLKTVLNNSGYYSVHFDFIHRLVAIHFVPNPDNKPEVNHKDGKKANNFYLNLEWCTRSENNIHAFKNKLSTPTRGEISGMSKLTKEDVLKIRAMYKTGNYTCAELGDLFKVRDSHVSRIIRRKRWAHV